MKEKLNKITSPEITLSLNEEETLRFLERHGIRQLQEFKPNQPLLYVFEDIFRGDDGPFKFLPPDQRPSIARVHNPIALNLDRGQYNSPDREISDLQNEGGQVDLYAINRQTEAPFLVGQEFKYKLYQISRKGLFESNDELFPQGEVKKSI